MTALSIRSLVKRYDNGFEAVKGIDLDVPAGSFYALLGPNGAGKSTTIGMISSLIKPTEGSIKVFDVDTQSHPNDAKRYIGLVPQEINLNMWEKCEDILCYQAGYYGVVRREALKRAEVLLKEMDLWEKRHQPVRTLSGGMKRRMMIARALMHNPKLLILDEPTAGVDIEIRRSMWRFLEGLNQSGTTIILTTHYLEEAEALCNKVGIIDRGTIVEQGDVKALLSRANYETFVLDVDAYSILPEVDGFVLTGVNAESIEVQVPRERGINTLMTALTEANIRVFSMRNKSNRLEEFFLRLVQKGAA
ncbi:MAG: ABC transporter ATP-binding protein [Gammaproteobacteria bacterium]|nr:ABC transporter ATP-binding protein [Gammaproteobacteria bacterium]